MCCSLTLLSVFLCLIPRPFMMPNLIPPKIPDGEKVDFDVSDRLGIKTEGRLCILCIGSCLIVYCVILNITTCYVGIDMSMLCLFYTEASIVFTLYSHSHSHPYHEVQEALNPCFCRIYIVKGWRRT